jgi:hypothetical protein
MSILEIIKPIKLLAGTHADTGTTGRGCFMNVIAYLNGEPQITDKSKCVCPIIREVAIYANDYASNEDRPKLLPFITRAMGSRTDDPVEMKRRLGLVLGFARRRAEQAISRFGVYDSYALISVSYSDRAIFCAHYGDVLLAAEFSVKAADFSVKKVSQYCELTHELLALLDELCPKAEVIEPVHIERAKELAALVSA